MSNFIGFPPDVWAADLNFPTDANPWSSTPTKVAPIIGAIRAGAAPAQQIAAQHFNWLTNLVTGNELVHACATMSGWARSAIGGSSDVLNHLVPVKAPAGFAGATTAVAAVAQGASAGEFALSLDCRNFGGFISNLTPNGYSCISAGSNGTLIGALTGATIGSDFRFTTDWGGSFAFAAPGNAGAINACHITPSGAVLAAYDGKVFRAATPGGTYTNTTLHAHDTAIQFVDNGSTIVLLTNVSGFATVKAWYSTDDGATWTVGRDFGATSGTITYSAYLGLFLVLTQTGGLWTSTDGVIWVLSSTAASLAPTLRPHSLATVGPVIAVLTNRGPTNGCYARGVAWTADLSATWRETYFGSTTDSTLGLLELVSANGHFIACDKASVYVSGALQSTDTLYVGV